MQLNNCMFAACVPSCTTCAYTADTTKSYSTCSACSDLYALTTAKLCNRKSSSLFSCLDIHMLEGFPRLKHPRNCLQVCCIGVGTFMFNIV